MLGRLHSHLRSNLVGYVALFFALSGSAYAVATVNSADVTDESLKSVDLKNGAAVKSEDVVNDNVSGGGLAGPDIKELTLAKVPDADKLDGLDSTDFVRPSTDLGYVSRGFDAQTNARVGFDMQDVPAGDTLISFAARNLAIYYHCPADPVATNGSVTIQNSAESSDLFVDNGTENPSYVRMNPNTAVSVATAASGEALTIQLHGGPDGFAGSGGNLQTIMMFSVHRPGLQGVNAGYCHVQGQIFDGLN